MKKSIKRAKEHLVGGVNSPVRSFNYVDVDPILIKKARGSKLYDENGKAYIDYVLSFGANILGHAHKDVVKNAHNAVSEGMSYGMTTPYEIELAELIKKGASGMDKIRFVNSGTEALMSAVRLARGYTGREKVVKFADSYHGHADQFLVKGGSGLATLGIPFSKGVPKDFAKHTLLAEYGNKDNIDKIFKKHGNEIAAVVVEPAGGNYGVIPPDEDFLKHIREITKKYRSVLIFDEVITGFRFAPSTLADILGIEPDLYCLGKIIGGGLPVGAYGGSKKIMKHLAPEGEVYQASTFGGNPVVVRSGIAALKALVKNKKRFKELEERTEDIAAALVAEGAKNGLEPKVVVYGSMFSIKFENKSEFKKFYKILLKEGVFFAPSEYEANFISFAHEERDLKKTRAAIRKAMRI